MTKLTTTHKPDLLLVDVLEDAEKVSAKKQKEILKEWYYKELFPEK